MRKNLRGILANSFCFAFIIIVIGSYVIVAQTPFTGEWKGDTRNHKQEDKGTIHLSLERRSDKGGRNRQGSTYSFSDLEGLTREQTQNGKANFRIVREAGSIEFDGLFTDGKGAGTFVFTPSQAFVSGMQSRGYSMSDDKQFAATTLNLTLAFVDELKTANLGTLDVDDLFKARIFKITPQFIAEMKATGFPDMGLENLVKARIFKIDADYIRQVHSMGFDNKNFESLVKFRIFKVTPEFLTELKNAGFSNLSSEDVVKFRIFKVTPELLTQLRSEGFANLSAEEIVKFRIFKIDTDFIRQAKAENPNITVEELVRKKIGDRNR